ncbi:MAG: roadblock/LC7 domain-containing protein [Gemmatimonadales bacterium]
MAGAARMSAAHVALERVTQVAGVRGSLLISAGDGLVVAERLMDGIDGRAIAALAANLIQRLVRATLGAGMQIPTFVHLRGNAGSVLAAPGTNDLVLVALVGLDANLGLARLEMLDAIGRLA